MAVVGKELATRAAQRGAAGEEEAEAAARTQRSRQPVVRRGDRTIWREPRRELLEDEPRHSPLLADAMRHATEWSALMSVKGGQPNVQAALEMVHLTRGAVESEHGDATA